MDSFGPVRPVELDDVIRSTINEWRNNVTTYDNLINAVVDAVWSQREPITEAVLTARKDAFSRSFDIECPECGMPPGHECMNMGSAGGPVNHTVRIEAVK